MSRCSDWITHAYIEFVFIKNFHFRRNWIALSRRGTNLFSWHIHRIPILLVATEKKTRHSYHPSRPIPVNNITTQVIRTKNQVGKGKILPTKPLKSHKKKYLKQRNRWIKKCIVEFYRKHNFVLSVTAFGRRISVTHEKNREIFSIDFCFNPILKFYDHTKLPLQRIVHSSYVIEKTRNKVIVITIIIKTVSFSLWMAIKTIVM